MTILQQPDALSLSQNLKEFHISSDVQVSFILKQGGVEILSQRYDPSADGHITINLRDIVHARLSYQLIESGQVYEQSSLASDFTAMINDTTLTFRVIRSGIDRLADSAANFLTQNFLTWQPSIKPVTYYSPEFLTYYATIPCVAKLRAYFTDTSGSVISQTDYTVAEMVAGIAYTIPLQYSVVAGWLGHKLPAYYDIWVENLTGQRLTYIQRYYAEDMRTEQEQWILFENSLGGLDTFRAYGTTTFSGEHTHNLAEIDEISQEYRVDTERKFQKNTGHLNQDERKWLLDFFPSQAKYLYAGNYLRQIVVTESNVSYTDRALPSNYTFTFKYADARPLLNLPRTDIPADVLSITVPKVGSFTVPPRLAEFPRLPLSEGALFPIQNPYSEEWGITTAEAFATFVGQQLAEFAGSGGGIGHQHRNIDLLNLLSYVAEYLLVNNKKIKAGYADIAGDIEGDKYIHKDRVDRTDYLLQFGEFIDSLIAGKGGGIYPDGRAQFNTLEVRSSAIFLEVIFNRLSAMESDYSFSESGTIESVELLEDGTYRLPLRKRWENDFTALAENDVVYGMVNNLASGGGDYYTSWLRVLNVNTVSNTITAVMYPDDEVPGGKNYPPEPLMILSHRGNPVNEDSQAYWYLSSREKCICMLDGVTKPILEENNYAIIIGKLKQLSLFDNLPINYRHSYIYCRGIAIQDLLRIDDYQGTPVRSENNRGPWSSEDAVNNPYQSTDTVYDAVYHVGCKWMCLVTGTTQEPKWNATDWAQIEGNSELTLEFSSSNGYTFFAGKVDTEITPVVYWGYNDISADVLAGDWSWTRDSGQVTEDNAWSVAHANNGRVLHLTNEDMPSNWGTTRKVKFTCTAYVRDGIESINIENSIIV
jgi:conserved domain protein